MHLNEAQVLCDFCGKHIRKEEVYSPSSEKLVKVKFEMCTDCRSQFSYDYDELSHTYAIAACLSLENIPEKIIMRGFVQYSLDLAGTYVVKQLKICSVHFENTIRNERGD